MAPGKRLFLPWIFGINNEKEQLSASVVFRSKLKDLDVAV